MMDQMMNGGMWGMGIGMLVVIILALLGIIALAKFIFFR